MDSTSWSHNPHWNTFWGQFTIELLGGVLGAIIFLFIVLIFLRPRIELATFLCKQNSEYLFKFINKSYFNAHEIRIELNEVVKIPRGNGYFNNSYRQLSLVYSEIMYLQKKPLYRTNKEYKDCVVIKTKEDLSSILGNSNRAVVITISLKHGLTGISEVFEKDYATPESIKTGSFKSGTKFVVHR